MASPDLDFRMWFHLNMKSRETGASETFLITDEREYQFPENLLLYSEEFNQSNWVKGRSAIAATNTIQAPDGTQTAEKLVDNTASGSHRMYQVSALMQPPSQYTLTLHVKAAEFSRCRLALTNQVESFRYYATFDLVSETITSTSGTGASSIEALTDGWYKISVTGNLISGDTSGAFFFYLINNSGILSYVGTGNDGMYIWGAQAYLSSNQGPYIKTTTSAIEQDTAFHFPILKSVNGLGSSMDNYLPARRRGSIELNCKAGSFGHERRILDYFERYECIEQELTLYTRVGELDSVFNPDVSGQILAKTIVESWRYNPQSGILTLSVVSDPLPNKTITKVLEANGTIPEGSVGQALPVVIGSDVECRALPLDSNQSGAVFACATTLGTDHKISAINSIKARAKTGNFLGYSSRDIYAEVEGAATTSTALFGNPYQSGKTYDTWSGDELKIGFAFTPTTGRIITWGEWACYNTASASDGGVRISVHLADDQQRVNPRQTPGTELGSFVVDAASFATSSVNRIQGNFSSPIVLVPGLSYWFVVEILGGTSLNFYPYLDSAVASSFNYYLVGPGIASQGNWVAYTGGLAKKMYWSLGGATISLSDSSAADANGLGLASATFSQRTDLTLGDRCYLSSLDLVFGVDGLEDDSSGTYTSSASSQITQISHAVNVIGQTFDGSSWLDNQLIDVSEYSAELSALNSSGIQPRGRTSGRTTFRQFLEEICRSCGVRVGLRNDGLALFAYGTKQDSKGVITDRDATILQVQCLAASRSVINRHIMNYDERLTRSDLINFSNQNDLKNYAGYLARSEANGGWWSDLFANSTELYGVRELQRDRYSYIKDQIHAEQLSRILGGLSGRYASWLVEFEVPLIKYLSLDIFDVYELMHPQLPSFFGSSSHAQGEYFGTSEGALDHYPPKRAKLYRVAIEGKELDWTGSGEVPRLRVLGRILFDDLEPL